MRVVPQEWEASVTELLTDTMQSCPAPAVANCVLVGQDETIKLAFFDVPDGGARGVRAVTLTLAQAEAMAGMLCAFLDSDDHSAVALF